ncbi:MAG TPA: hypothetical protein PKV66_00400 [Candidatus Pelethenecus sp.]|nr:hypothetical protein [Candidatus Pelethenecus sp.]
MIIAVFINEKGSNVFVWDSNYISEYSQEEMEQYHTIIVYDDEADKKLYEKIYGEILINDKEI